MNIIKKLGIMGIIFGIWCVWLTSITNEYIDDDGWIFYPMFGTIIFLTICFGLYLLFQLEQIYFCRDCKKYCHNIVLKGYKVERFPNVYVCEHCYEKLKNKRKESIDGDED